MISVLNRNPERMMKFGLSAMEIVENMNESIRKIQADADVFKNEYDEPTRKKVEELDAACEECKRELHTYHEIAFRIYDNGKKIAEIRGN